MSRCERCGSALAIDQLSLDHRCPPCDVAYYESRDRLHTHAWFAAGLVLPWLLFAWVAIAVDLPQSVGKIRAFSTGVPLLDVAIMTVIVAVFAGRLAVTVRRWFHRRGFERVLVGNVLRTGRRAEP